MSKTTEELSRQIREQASSRRGKQWSHADRLTNAYLLLELARTIIEEYEPGISSQLGREAARTLELARWWAAEGDTGPEERGEDFPGSEDDTAWNDDNWEIPAGQPGSPY